MQTCFQQGEPTRSVSLPGGAAASVSSHFGTQFVTVKLLRQVFAVDCPVVSHGSAAGRLSPVDFLFYSLGGGYSWSDSSLGLQLC